MEWQPIETAPKDQDILMWSEKHKDVLRVKWGGFCRFNQPKFTHWMPLPAPPVTP